jgi:D-tyrosyl-tRNA(Tyr) deacylase
MIALIQRVIRADVQVDNRVTGAIGTGILALVGVARGDSTQSAERLLERVLTYRIFPDAEGKMNLSLRDINGGLLLAPQFTLAADTQKGTRAGFSTAAAPDEARRLFDHLVEQARVSHASVG